MIFLALLTTNYFVKLACVVSAIADMRHRSRYYTTNCSEDCSWVLPHSYKTLVPLRPSALTSQPVNLPVQGISRTTESRRLRWDGISAVKDKKWKQNFCHSILFKKVHTEDKDADGWDVNVTGSGSCHTACAQQLRSTLIAFINSLVKFYVPISSARIPRFVFEVLTINNQPFAHNSGS